MFKFNEFIIEKINDSLETSRPEETERHRKQYYSDATPDDIFHKLGGRYILDKDRTDLHPDFKKGNEVKLSHIEQRHDQNGILRYHGVTEDGKSIPMGHFKKPPIGRAGKNQQSLEHQQVEHIQNAIQSALRESGGKSIRLRTADGVTHNVAGIKLAPGDRPKADAYLHDEDGNAVHWMSLKGDTFQQWGGYKGLENHPALKPAIEKFQNLKDAINPGERYLPSRSAYHIDLDPNNPSHKDLLLKSMYGLNHGKEYGPNNVHAIYSGNTVNLKKSENPGEEGIFELHPNALYLNKNDVSSDVPPAKILVTNRAGLNQQGTGGRIMISHRGNVSSSKNIDDVFDKMSQSSSKPRSLSVAVNDTTETPEPTVAKKPTPQKPKTSTLGGLQLPS